VILGIDANAPLITWFWDVLEEFSNEERSLFLRFVWGRTRLPRTIADFRGRDFVIQVCFCNYKIKMCYNLDSLRFWTNSAPQTTTCQKATPASFC
jgi:HECT-domain (ubiquitin-transferase)